MVPDFRNSYVIEQILGRSEAEIRLSEGILAAKTLLVTGAGGFIGSEVCAEAACLKAERIVAVEASELNLFHLIRSQPSVVPELADLRNEQRTRGIFERWRPDAVIHAAAFKHLPLLESFPGEAFENNAVVSGRLADLAGEFGTRSFVLVSSDKAASPTSVLGASKRAAELLVMDRFSALRCGNVLASPGSVLEIWADQIERGEKLSITDLTAERYFMTVREAARSLLYLATQFKDPRGLFTYALKEAITLAELATRLQRVMGKLGNGAYRIIGLRAGEKHREKLHSEDETVSATECSQILRIQTFIK